MKRTKKFHAEGYYIFESRASANSNYIEKISEARRLMVYANYYLNGYLKIHDYVITRHGWQMIVSINHADSFKMGNGEVLGSGLIWRQVSERVRLFISTYVRCINKVRGRSGVLVHSNYKRYYFENIEEAQGHLDKIRNQQIKLYEKKKKYRGIKRHYKISREAGKGSVYLCSKELKSGNDNAGHVQLIRPFEDFVLPEMVEKTLTLHTIPFKDQKKQNSS